MGQIFDWDGTITGKPGSTIVRDQPFYTSSLCESRPNWGNMSICPHQYAAAEGTGTGYTEQGTYSLDSTKNTVLGPNRQNIDILNRDIRVVASNYNWKMLPS